MYFAIIPSFKTMASLERAKKKITREESRAWHRNGRTVKGYFAVFFFFCKILIHFTEILTRTTIIQGKKNKD